MHSSYPSLQLDVVRAFAAFPHSASAVLAVLPAPLHHCPQRWLDDVLGCELAALPGCPPT
eukprot:560410-Pelagomonas_calceolata.AAC.6